ncbi:charged multivesicular body protein 6-like [Oppia nitens]|uniref:charged multivesicular body protein 6-like n=1 Tax=Oppia nitens TaxID=1686743 RepID=UPI0023DB62B9|nr:charged multivesicular body protein 6-like [Oppia nitens]
MGNLFGKSKSKTIKKDLITEADKAILQLKQQRDSVKRYQKRIIDDIDKERQIARQLVKDNKKEKALLLLKKKKYMETILEKTDNQLINLEKLVSDIEFKQIETKIIDGLQTGNEALKQLHQILSIEKIEDILEETKEGIEKQKEIDDLLLGLNIETDEESLLQELDQMLDQTTDNLPEVPQTELVIEEKTKEKTPTKRTKEVEALLES